MRVSRVVLSTLIALAVSAVFSASALAVVEAPGWQLFANTYPTNLVHPIDAVQEVVANEASGTFTLGYDEVEAENPIPDHATNAELQAALESIPTIGAGNVSVSGDTPGRYTITFVGLLGNMQITQLEANGARVSVQTAGAASGTIGIDVFNDGAGASSGAITLEDTLPPGVRAKEAGQLSYLSNNGNFGTDPQILTTSSWRCTGNGPGATPSIAGATVVTCTDTDTFEGGGGAPTFGESSNFNYAQPAVGITVEAPAEASNLTNHVTISGGGALEPAAAEDSVTISSKPAAGGLTSADAWLSSANGTLDRQAGSHPYLATFVYNAATALNPKQNNGGYLVGSEIRNLETVVPPGLVGDLRNMPQCKRQELLLQRCPPASMVGTLKSLLPEYMAVQKQIFNMVPEPGVPAELGFEYGLPVYISFHVRTGSDYAIVARVNNLPQREIFQSVVTLWGVPSDPSHDRWRARPGGCSQSEMERFSGSIEEVDYCLAPDHPVVTPFLTLPTACGAPQQYDFRELNGWQEPDAKSEASFPSHDPDGEPVGITGCESLIFEPSITTSPDTAKADTPTGLTVEVTPSLGGLEEPATFSSSDIEDTTVALPAGLVINPGQAAGLQACSSVEAELTTAAETEHGEDNELAARCPAASKVGTVVIKTPLIEGDAEKQFEGNVYVLQSNPPELRLLLAASADGVNLKLVGKTSLCETVGEVLDGKTCQAPGQIIASFEDTPQLPFTVFRLSFSGGAQAALATPTQCGSYTANADFTPWSSPVIADFPTSAAFDLSEGPGGTPCPSNPLPFTPTLTAGSTTDQAGGFTSFSMLLQRGDGQQRIEKLQFKIPQGLSGMISKVTPCAEADAAAGTCSAASQIGHAVVTSGPGPYPLVIPQPGEPEAPIYLTGPYKGAPFGLSIVVPVIAGPFNLGTIVTRAAIAVDPHTAQITVTTDALPQIVKGVPTDLREVDAVIDRPGFMFNPTNCNPQSFSGTATSAQGTTATISSPFGMGSCQGLKFAPKFSVSVPAHSSRLDGAGLTATLSYPVAAQGTQTNIAKVKVSLPKQLPSRLTTLQKACTNAQFEANPANCPAASKIGYATVSTPLLPVPLTGPAIFVSHGGEAFPSLTLVLQGDNVTVDVVGATYISHAGITSTTFQTVPDVPFSTFTLTLAQGQYSALAANLPAKANGSFCGQKLTMPTVFNAQNGAEIHQTTPIAVAGCSKAKKATKKQQRKRAHGKRKAHAPAKKQATAQQTK